MKLPLVHRTISKSKFPFTVLFPFLVLTVIYRSVWPCLEAKAMLFVVFPLADILGAISMRVCSFSIRFVIEPISLVNISICMI